VVAQIRKANNAQCLDSKIHLMNRDTGPFNVLNILQRTASHSHTLQRTASHCDTLQRTATHLLKPQGIGNFNLQDICACSVREIAACHDMCEAFLHVSHTCVHACSVREIAACHDMSSLTHVSGIPARL